MVISLTGNQTIEKKGALAEAYAETIRLVESMMGGATSAYIAHKPTVFVNGRGAIPTHHK